MSVLFIALALFIVFSSTSDEVMGLQIGDKLKLETYLSNTSKTGVSFSTGDIPRPIVFSLMKGTFKTLDWFDGPSLISFSHSPISG